MSKRQQLAVVMHKTGGWRLLDLFWGPQRLTVLGYHRICDPASPGFSGLESNVSATPAMFARQMDYVKRRFNVISLEALRAYVADGVALPPRPLLITFDDGYLDNYTHAYPILRERGLPAVLFVVSRWLGSAYRPWWDTCADLFRHTAKTRAVLFGIGERDLGTPAARHRALEDMLPRLKALPDEEKQRQVIALGEVLEVSLPDPQEQRFFSAAQAREMAGHGVVCQMHTASHPILTRIPFDMAQAELAECRDTLEAEIGGQMVALAYPNGMFEDFNPAIMAHLRSMGISLAFTLENGPIRLGQLRRRALEIPRVFLIFKDTIEVFQAKVLGIPAFTERPRYYG